MSNESLDPLYAVVFANPENGTPDNVTQAGCLALARLGKEAWNAWRLKYPVKGKFPCWENVADFNGVNFKQNPIDFSDFKFDHQADFTKAIFGHYCFFKNAEFGNNSKFDGAIFGKTALFAKAQFGEWTRFVGTIFGDNANFERTYFGDNTAFAGAQFDTGARFGGTYFAGYVFFSGTQFGNFTSFEGTQFIGIANFIGLSWDKLHDAYSIHDEGLQNAKTLAGKRGLNPDSFGEISFAGATFKDRANFSDRIFTRSTSFGCLVEAVKTADYAPNGDRIEIELTKGHPITFKKAPLFHNCKLHQDTTFDDSDETFPKPSSDPSENDTAARAYRTLKLAFSQHQATREEQFFFRLEMAEEAARAPCTLKWLFWLYSRFSDYGFSISRPIGLLFFTLPVFTLIYSCLAGLAPCWLWTEGCQIKSELLQFTLMQALPLPGFDKWSESLRECLFLTHPSAWLPFFVMLHKTIALLALFLSGLALRNLFKMK